MQLHLITHPTQVKVVRPGHLVVLERLTGRKQGWKTLTDKP